MALGLDILKKAKTEFWVKQKNICLSFPRMGTTEFWAPVKMTDS